MEITKKISNAEGLHARPAGIFAKTAMGFQSKIEVVFGTRKVNAKSSMSLMTLGLKQGSEIQISAEGADAEKALSDISSLIDSEFKA